MIEIRELEVKYKSKTSSATAIEGFNLNITNGDILTLIGPSGCGKSTLLNVLSGIITDYSGRVLVNGKPVNPKTQSIGMVFQSYGLLPWKNVYDNATLGLKIKGNKYKELEARLYAEKILKQLGIYELRSSYPKELSGGQKQRVAIARAFIIKPSILLLDEPFSALDEITREEMQEVFLNIWREHRVTTVFVTHSVEEALYLGKKVAILSNSPGKIYKLIDNDIFGINNLRFSEEFYKKVSEIRKIIEMGWGK